MLGIDYFILDFNNKDFLLNIKGEHMKKIVIFGDSIVEWNRKLSYINYGQAGYRTRDVFWQLEELENLDGDLGILMVGVNDILCGYELDYTLDYYKKCVTELKKRFKKLLLVSMLPTDDIRVNRCSIILNKKLQELYKDEFFDIYNKFLDKDLIANRYTTDGVHLNHCGYELLNFYLENKVDKIFYYPTIEEGEKELIEAGKLNPGRWIGHSQHAALACKKIAEHCPHLDSEKAYLVGLLHDIGRRIGIVQEKHMIEGYKYCLSKGWTKLAQTAISHGFMLKDIKSSVGKWDVSEEDYKLASKIIEEAEYDDYDRLIQMCDSLALPDRFCLLETRFVDVALRYGVNEHTTEKWRKILEIKKYFDKVTGMDIYDILEVGR